MNQKAVATLLVLSSLGLGGGAFAENRLPFYPVGVTYNGLHATDKPDKNSVDADLAAIQGYTNPANATMPSIRTYYPQYMGTIGLMNELKAQTPSLKVLLGLYLFEYHNQPASWTVDNFNNFIKPFLSPADPQLTGVLIGNEEGAASVGTVKNYLGQVAAINKSLPVGSAQKTDFWLYDLSAPDLANACDFIAVNLYPGWNWQGTDNNNQPTNGSGASLTPEQGFESFKAQYGQLVQKYPGKQIVVTETGWPTTYGKVDQVPPPRQYQTGLDNAKAYFKLVSDWAQQNQVPVFYFSMFDDHQGLDTSSPFNPHFGLLDVNRAPKTAN